MRKLIYAILLSFSFLTSPVAYSASHTATEFVSPTQRLLKATPLNQIKPYLKAMGVDDDHVKIMNKAIEAETVGFFGYHGARREFLIFQDIIRFGIEEILEIPLREDFHFMRIPGHPSLNVFSAEEFLRKHSGALINDNLPMERMQLLAMTMALYTNYQDPWEISLHYFTQNTNVAQHNYKDVLVPFFLLMGVDPVYIDEAFAIGEALLTKKSGVLIQFFDSSAYDLVDQYAYLARKKGELISPNSPLSALLWNPQQTNFPQFRLVLNNHGTLNPNSTISMKRYTLTPSKEFKNYQNTLRKYFQTLPYDVSQKENYRFQLISLWGLEGVVAP